MGQTIPKITTKMQLLKKVNQLILKSFLIFLCCDENTSFELNSSFAGMFTFNYFCIKQQTKTKSLKTFEQPKSDDLFSLHQSRTIFFSTDME